MQITNLSLKRILFVKNKQNCFGGIMFKVYVLTIIIMSVIELVLFSYDKVASMSHRFRIPVYVLMLPIGFGGAVGALISMLLYRHKTEKMFFKIPICFSAIIQIILLVAMLFI